MQIMHDAFTGNSDILTGPVPKDSRGGVRLGTVRSELAKRLLSVAIRFGLSLVDVPRDNPAVGVRYHNLFQIFSHLGWLLVAKEDNAYLGKRLRIRTNWEVFTMPEAYQGQLTVENYAPEPGSRAGNFVESL